MQYEFYSELYTTNSAVRFNLTNHDNVNVIHAEHKLLLEAPINKDELFDAMMTLKRGKTPGCDGLSISLYYRFWKLLFDPLFEMYSAALAQGMLNPSGKRGIINLIPKKSSNELEVKGWRPISILNNDYKIWAKAISNRLEMTTYVINQHQTGFVKNRSILNNIRKTMEIVANVKKSNKPGIIVTVDFSKCFDRIEYNSIRGAFKSLGFGDNFVNMMFLLFNQLEMCTSNNGYFSNFFIKTRGVNQGCPASPLIHNYCCEIMSRLILDNKKIRGITVHGIENILAQFADDTSAYLESDQLVVNEFTRTMEKVEAQLGLQVSYEKTTLYKVGSLHNSDAQFYTQNNLKWSDDSIEMLGVLIPSDGSNVDNKNVDQILVKIRQTCNKWMNRKSSLMGKILIVNTLIGSLFVYKMSVMLNLYDEQVKLIESIIRDFIWNGKRPKIALELMQKDKKDDGLRLVNLRAKQDSIKIAWIFKEKDEFLNKSMYVHLDSKITELIWRCNLNCRDARTIFVDVNFWTETLYAWCKVNYSKVEGKQNILNQILWYNSWIRVNDMPICWHHWIDKGIIIVEDLFDHEGNPLDPHVLGVNWLELSSIRNALPIEWREELKENTVVQPMTELYKEWSGIKQVSRVAYNRLIKDSNYGC